MEGGTIFVFSVCIWIYITSTKVESCNVNEFECSNGNCIDVAGRCDDNFDCTDFSDEENCGGTIFCPEAMYRCDDGECVQNAAQCKSIVSTISSSLILDTVQLTSLEETSSFTQTVDSSSTFQVFPTVLSTDFISTLPTEVPSESTQTMTPTSSTQTYLLNSTLSTYMSVDDLSASDQISFQKRDSALQESTIFVSSSTLNSMTYNQPSSFQTIGMESSILYSSIDTSTKLSLSLSFEPTTSQSTEDKLSALYSSAIASVLYSLDMPSSLYSSDMSSSLYSSDMSSSLYSSDMSSSLYSSDMSSALYSSDMPSALYSSDMSSALYSSDMSSALYSSDMSSALYSSDMQSALYSSDLSSEVFQLSTTFGQTQKVLSTPNTYITTPSSESLFRMFVSSVLVPTSVLSSEMSTVTVMSTTPSTTKPPDDDIDKDILIPIIIVGCLVLILICVAAWKLREFIRKHNRKSEFGSIVSLDMVHPHPDMKGAPVKHIPKVSSYNSLKYI